MKYFKFGGHFTNFMIVAANDLSEAKVVIKERLDKEEIDWPAEWGITEHDPKVEKIIFFDPDWWFEHPMDSFV